MTRQKHRLAFDSIHLYTYTHTTNDSVQPDVGYATPPAVQMELQITGPSCVY